MTISPYQDYVRGSLSAEKRHNLLVLEDLQPEVIIPEVGESGRPSVVSDKLFKLQPGLLV